MKNILPSRILLRNHISCLFFVFSFFLEGKAQIINTVAGDGTAGFYGDGGAATSAELNLPSGVAFDTAGNMYIAVRSNSRVRKVSKSGIITTIAGGGSSLGDGGQATAAQLSAPYDVCLDASGNIYIADGGGSRIRKVNTSGIISTFAGNGHSGYTGDGGAATAAEVGNPLGIIADASGNVYVADQGYNCIRKINTSGVISTFAGNGTANYSGDGGQATAAELNHPYSVNVDDTGNIYIADKMNYRIRKVNTSGIITTIAGNGTLGNSGNGGQATNAEFTAPTGVLMSASGILYIVDGGASRVRKVNTSGIISSAAGNSVVGYTGDGGQAISAELDGSMKAAFDNIGNLYITDQNNNVIREVYLTLNATTSITANVTCNGGNNGSASVSASNGTSPYTYSWSSGASSSSQTTLSAGIYTITVTDADGITGSATAIVTQPTALSVSTSITANVSCNGSSNGSISATPSGGVSPYTYSWSGGGTNSTKTGLTAGTYSITITDKNGCMATSTATITQPTSLSVSASVTANASSNGESDGSVSTTPSGGTSPYTYSWSDGGTSSTETGLIAGGYTLTLTDNHGCTATASSTITQPLGAYATVLSEVSTIGGSDGSILAIPSGGASSYAYLWTGGTTTATISGLSAGTYTVAVTDADGISATVIATINQPISYTDQLQTNILSSEETVGVNTSLAVGKTPYTYGVSQSGAANYSVPIVVPPGTMGMAPNLSVAYNSQSPGGSLGYGWNLSGLSCISREGQTPFHNFGAAYPDQTQGVTLTNSDWFTLDGNRLIAISGSYGINGTAYATESETYNLIISNGAYGTGPDWFEVQTKNGLIMEYGHTNDSRLVPVGKSMAYAWYIDRITDQFGNYLTFRYMNSNGEAHIQEIDYTGNSGAGFTPYNTVVFSYNTRTDPNTTYVAGGALNSTVVLNDITINSHSTFFKKYSFKYTTNLYSLLQEIDETGSDNTTLNPIRFSYGTDNPVVSSICGSGASVGSNYSVRTNPSSSLPSIGDGSSGFGGVASYTLLDYNGDGKEDVITLLGGYEQLFEEEGPDLPLNQYGYSFSSQTLYTGETPCPYFTSNSYGFPWGYPSTDGISTGFDNPVNDSAWSSLSQVAADFNGDGRDDYAVSTFSTTTTEGANQEEDIHIALSTGSSFATANTLVTYDMYNTPSELLDEAYVPIGSTLSCTLFLDLNGDGQTDVFNYHCDPVGYKEYYRIWLNAGSSSTTPSAAPTTQPNFEITIDESGYGVSLLDFSKAIPMDLNGDGKTELVNVTQWNNGTPQKVIVSFDATQVNHAPEVNGTVTTPGKPGNGIIITPDVSGFQYNINTYAANNPSGEYVNPFYNPADSAYTSSFPHDNYDNIFGNVYGTSITAGVPYELFGDFNGDGITDVLTCDSATGNWTMNFGKGAGNYASLAVSTLSSDNPFNFPTHYYYAQDVNGDGKTDILEFTPNYMGSGNTVIKTYYSTGISFIEGDTINLENHDINPNTWQIAFGDFNGDGVADLLLEPVLGDGAIDGPPLLIYFYSGSQSRQMVEAVDGYNETVQFTYQPLTNSDIYTRPNASGYRSSTNSNDLLDIQPPMYVVSRLTSVDGTGNHSKVSITKDGNSNYVTYTDTNTTIYAYQDAIFNRQGLGFLGFLNVGYYNYVTNNITSNTYSVSTSSAIEALVPSTNVTATASLTPISDGAYTYTAVVIGGLRYTMQETESVHNDDVAGVTNTTDYAYDSYGNVTDKNSQISITSTSAVVETSDVQTTYVASGTLLPAVVSTNTTTVTYLSNPSYTRTLSNSWDSYGHLLSTTTDPSTTGSVTTANTYDTHTGAILSYTTTTTDANCIATPEVNSTTYDTWSQFKTSSTNPLGQITYYTYNDMWGKPYIVTTPDGLTTDYYYDGYGRSSSILTPDGLTQTLTYAWVTSGDLPVVSADPFDITATSLYSVYSDKPGSPPLQTYYDWFDRKTFVETSTLTANVFKEQSYDALGHDYQSTNTYQKASISSDYGDYDPVITTKLYSDIEYRLTNVTSTCASAPTLTTTVTYTSVAGNTTITTTKPDGTTSSQTTDPAGMMVNSTDYLLSSPTTVYSTVDYTYLSNGHTASVTLNGEPVQSFTYDAYGRQTSLSDVNFTGNYSYIYNAYNQIYRQEDPNGDTYTMTYDVLGRPVTKVSSAEGTYTYNYVSSGDGLNQLLNQQLVNTATSYTSTISYTYDYLHRPLTMDVNGLTTTYTYDPTYGYLINKTYPGSGFEITNIYDASNYGYLVETDNTATSSAIWTANVMNPAGQYVDYTLGDGVHTKKSYTPYGLLTGISGGSYQSCTYDFDPTNGNLSDRTENSLSETFVYDASLNSRLVTATTYTSAVETAILTMDYDQNGNIESKSDICATSTTYTDVTGNNQIAQVPNSSSLIDPGQSVTYTSFNAPLTMSLGNYSMTFAYGPDNNREQTVLTDASTSYTTTRTYGNGYEKTVYTDGTPTTEINYIQCGGDLVGMYVNQPSGGDMYYVYSDHLGSILTVTDGTNTYNQSFDVWGNYRNPANGVVGGAMTGPVPPAWLYRGFTGHEHLPEFQLINANGRLYDPLVGSMLSPDITVQSPTNTQNFNRYSYCMNNPLKYSDPSGFIRRSITGDAPAEWRTFSPTTSPVSDGAYSGGTPTYTNGGETGGEIGQLGMGGSGNTPTGADAEGDGLPGQNVATEDQLVGQETGTGDNSMGPNGGQTTGVPFIIPQENSDATNAVLGTNNTYYGMSSNENAIIGSSVTYSSSSFTSFNDDGTVTQSGYSSTFSDQQGSSVMLGFVSVANSGLVIAGDAGDIAKITLNSGTTLSTEATTVLTGVQEFGTYAGYAAVPMGTYVNVKQYLNGQISGGQLTYNLSSIYGPVGVTIFTASTSAGFMVGAGFTGWGAYYNMLATPLYNSPAYNGNDAPPAEYQNMNPPW